MGFCFYVVDIVRFYVSNPPLKHSFSSISLVAGECGSGSQCSVRHSPHYRGEERLILLL